MSRYLAFERIPKRNYDWYVIIAAIIVILVIVFLVLVFIRYRNTSTQLKGLCPVGLCAYSKQTGEKRCPVGDEQIEHDVALEGCTSRDYCQDSPFSCAVLASGILNPDGVCNPGGTVGNGQCKCVLCPQ